MLRGSKWCLWWTVLPAIQHLLRGPVLQWQLRRRLLLRTARATVWKHLLRRPVLQRPLLPREPGMRSGERALCRPLRSVPTHVRIASRDAHVLPLRRGMLSERIVLPTWNRVLLPGRLDLLPEWVCAVSVAPRIPQSSSRCFTAGVGHVRPLWRSRPLRVASAGASSRARPTRSPSMQMPAWLVARDTKRPPISAGHARSGGLACSAGGYTPLVVRGLRNRLKSRRCAPRLYPTYSRRVP